MPITPEDRARENIDKLLTDAGWIVQDRRATNLSAGRGVAVREFPLKSGHGEADYLLFVDGAPVGVVEAKKEGDTLTGVELQTTKYSEGVPDNLTTPRRPLPFQYQSTGVETRFTNLLEPDARSRRVFSFHRPDTLDQWLTQELQHPGSTLRAELRTLPELMTEGLRSAQIKAIRHLEASLAKDRPRALIQMASGGGKTFTACNFIYRLIKHAGAKRILFLVDRSNLGRQALAEFQKFRTPEENRLFTELYNVQRMQSNKLDDVSKVCITTIQRLYAMLQGKEIDPELEEQSGFETSLLHSEPVPVSYNPSLPIETFDFIVTDECHRSIYNLWRQVLEYFDSFIIGLTATPSKQTLGFFNQNLVMEYSHEQAVADSVNVGFEVYRIGTLISERGSKVDAGFYVDKRDKLTRKVRWQQLEDDFEYGADELDRSVVAKDQIRTIIQTFRDRLFTEIFPGRTEVPKTLIFAKDDSHADDIVQIVREEFGKGNDFAQKITYRTGTARVVNKKKAEDGSETEEVTWVNTGAKPEHLLSSFRNSYSPRIAVTVDMIATGTDIKPLEIVFFMRSVRSRNFFEQMKGRGTRVIEPDELQAVTPDARFKTHFIIVDSVGLCEGDMSDTRPLERKRTVSFEKLLEGDALEIHYRHMLETLSKERGMLGVIFRKAQNKIQDPAKLRRLIADLIDKEQWTSLDADVKGDAYEGLLEKNAADVKGGAGQYFTPRPLIQAIVDVMRPAPGQTIHDPACGTGGFLLIAHDYVSQHNELDRDQKKHLKLQALSGNELVDSVARLCVMNLYLHGVGGDNCPIDGGVDSLAEKPSVAYEMVLTNPPFGKKSSITVINEEGDESKEALTYVRDDFWATTSNKQLNFLQHVKSCLKIHGRAAIVVPDNVLFEGGAGETIRRELLKQADVHTLLRLPTGIFYAQGVKANVLFFDRKPASATPWTKALWIYDFRTNEHFTLKTNPLKRGDLDDFVSSYNAENRHERKETERFKSFTYEDLLKRDKVSLDIFWLKDESLEDSANLPDPDVIAAEIAEDLQAALDQFTQIAADLRK